MGLLEDFGYTVDQHCSLNGDYGNGGGCVSHFGC